jgi:DNA-binding response OmpR family regulator
MRTRPWKDAIQDMTPLDAVEHLVGILEELVWDPPLSRSPLPGVHLTPSEARALYLLSRRGRAPREALLAAICADRTCGDMPEPQLVSVTVCKVRKKLDGNDLRIVPVNRFGYRLEGTAELQWHD